MRVTIRRTPRTLEEATGAKGRRLELTAEKDGARITVPAIERGPGSGWVYAKPGTYTAIMDETRLGARTTHRVIRILGMPVRRANGQEELLDSVLVHPANRVSQLAGCIAPGLREDEVGVTESGEALGCVFSVLGGFVKGKGLHVVVEEGETSEEFHGAAQIAHLEARLKAAAAEAADADAQRTQAEVDLEATQAELEAAEARVAELEARVAELEARVAELKEAPPKEPASPPTKKAPKAKK